MYESVLIIKSVCDPRPIVTLINLIANVAWQTEYRSEIARQFEIDEREGQENSCRGVQFFLEQMPNGIKVYI